MFSATNQEATVSEFITRPSSIEDLQHNHELAAGMSANCPFDDEHRTKVLAQHKQATRQEPCTFLGAQGFCVDCQVAFDIEHAQLALVA